MRWFPELDENGSIVPWVPDPPREIKAPAAEASDSLDRRAAGYWYILNRGNSLKDVVSAVNVDHQMALTVDEIQQVNPNVNPNRLKAGQKIFASAPLPQNPEEETAPTSSDGSGSVH
jgi:hypothetical protein